PTLYSVLALAGKAASVHFTDFVPSALADVRRWLAGEPGAHNWSPYTRTILELEGAPGVNGAVAHREATLRQKMTHVTECDARTTTMLDESHPPYDVVAAHHCLDVAARDTTDFKRMVRTLAEMLAPRGMFLLSVTTGTTWYTVDGSVFPCLDLSAEQVRESLIEARLDPQRIYQASMPVESEEYSGVLLSAGWKK
ncbi:MAG TPA: guanitoxin biosynthesis pre-guanitoxin forming N-methyltransferase GntF, partial [Anaerolineae bacterium]|nr:guanitoxin biosynthesis pre-guanitoxin forming N-methyltransferase GntF [Anaerolineae bacterium]